LDSTPLGQGAHGLPAVDSQLFRAKTLPGIKQVKLQQNKKAGSHEDFDEDDPYGLASYPVSKPHNPFEDPYNDGVGIDEDL
jgi:hypothetical protein